MDIEPGTVIEDRYVVEGFLGAGGMARVYRVRHRALGTAHALKWLTVTSPTIEARLLREGRLQARLGHRNVIAVQDVVRVRGTSALVMELVEGPSLAQLVSARPEPMEIAQLDALASGILAGVAAAHAMGFVHRDLKPSNVLVEVRDGAVVPRVGDFGLARAVDDEADDGATLRTRSGATLGTPQYMAPEQLRSARDVDARADVWSLGCLLYELAAGAPPFTGDVLELVPKVAKGEYVPIEVLRPDLPPRIVEAIAAALQVDRQARPADAAALLVAWAPAADAGVPASVWDQATVDQVRSLGSSGSSSAGTPSDPAATWDEGPPRTAVVEPKAGRPVRLRYVGLGAVVVAALVALFWAGPAPQRALPPVAPVTVEALLPDEAVPEGSRATLAEALDALFDARFSDAAQDAEMVAAMYDDPLPDLVIATASWAEGREGYADESLGRVDDDEDPRARAIIAARRSDELTAVANEPYLGLLGGTGAGALQAWLEAHPSDPVALLWRVWAAPDDLAGQQRHVEALTAALPDRALPHWLAARTARTVGRPGEARAAAARGLALDPGNAALRVEQALAARDAGDLQGAAGELDALVASPKPPQLAWVARASVDLALGREADRVEDVEQVRFPADLRVRFVGEHAAALAGAGRWSEARALLASGLEDCGRYKYAAERVRLAAERVLFDVLVEDDGALGADDGSGDLGALREALFALLDEGDDVRGPYLVALGRANAALAGRGRAVPEWMSARSRPLPTTPCLELALAAGPVAAMPEGAAVQALVDGLDRCDALGVERYARVLAELHVGRLAAADGDAAGARAAAGRARALWPSPDPDLPAARALAQLEAP